MELTPQQLKEDFKPYKVKMDRRWIEKDTEDFSIIFSSTIMSEMVARDCEPYMTRFSHKHIQRFGSAQDYDLHETKPYLDGSVQQIKRLIDCVSHVHIKVSKYARWQLSEAKLELINRN